MSSDQMEPVRDVLQHFQELYQARDAHRLDEAMQLFALGEEIEIIGIGACNNAGPEWFRGPQQIRRVLAEDWQYWGDVRLNVAEAGISVKDETAWLTTSGALVQSLDSGETSQQYLAQLREMLDVMQEEGERPDSLMMQVLNFSLHRLREFSLGPGYAWPLVFSAVLIKEEDQWKFHTLHWAMPAE